MNILGKNNPVTEPSFFALLVKSAQVQFLYLGVHTSVDSAFASALKQMEATPMYKPGEPVDIDLWNSIPIREVIQEITPDKAKEIIMKQVGDEQFIGIQQGIVKKPKKTEDVASEKKRSTELLDFEEWKKSNSYVEPEKKTKKRKPKKA